MVDDYMGYVGSNLGIVQYHFSCIAGQLRSKDTTRIPARTLKPEIYNSYISALTIPPGTNLIIGCALKTSVPIRYDLPSNSTYLSYIPVETEKSGVEYFERANYLIQHEPSSKFYNNDTYRDIKYIPSDQIFNLASTTTSVLRLKTYIDNVISAGYYPTKFLTFVKDGKLYSYLNKSFGKYIHLYIKHKIINTVIIDQYTYTLEGSETYYIPVKAANVLLNEGIVGYFVTGYIADGYVTEA